MLTDLTYSETFTLQVYLRTCIYIYCDKYVDSNLALALKCVCFPFIHTHSRAEHSTLFICFHSTTHHVVAELAKMCWMHLKYVTTGGDPKSMMQLFCKYWPLRTLTCEPLLFPTSPHTSYGVVQGALCAAGLCPWLHKAAQGCTRFKNLV